MTQLPSMRLLNLLFNLSFKRFFLNFGFFALLAPSFASADTYSGVVSKINTKAYLIPIVHPSNTLEMKALTADAQNILTRLQSGDFLEGSGGIVNNSLVLDSIDFVSLAALLGTWKNNSYWIRFIDFSHAELYLASEVNNGDESIGMQYSILPGADNSWRILFSSGEQVIAANLTLNDRIANFAFYNQVNGTSQVYRLTKLSDFHGNIHGSGR